MSAPVATPHDHIVQALSDLKHRVFPRPFERLGVAGSALVGVEIGVYKGAHAESLLTHLDIARLYLVDPYENYDGYPGGQRYDGASTESLEHARNAARERLRQYGDKVVWVERRSVDAARSIPGGLDFVYIDGNHDAASVSADIVSYYPHVRPGGVIGGHDFYNGFSRDHDGVVKAVTEFTVGHGLTLQVELPDWWVTKPATQPR